MSKRSAEYWIAEVIARLKRRYRREMRTSLNHSNAWELLVATMLSAQAQDAQVNKVTPGLFRRYPDIESYVHLRPVQLYPYISSIGLFRSKAKNIIGSARYISEHFCGTVPNDMDSMLMLPGVGRKTANVVLANYFGKNYGIAVDTHCITVSMRLFRYRTKNAEVIERRLMRFVPQKEWGNVNHLFIALGRDTCKARRKECGRCALIDLCPSSDLRMKKR